MTEEERSQRQRVFDLIRTARKRVNPKTSEHIAEVAQRHAEEDLQEYVRLYGWRKMVGQFEDDDRSQFRPTRSGHKNASGRYRQARDILEMAVVVNDLHLIYGELDLSALDSLIADYERRAVELEAEAERHRRVAEAMKTEGAETVADLGAERVALLYTGEEVSNA